MKFSAAILRFAPRRNSPASQNGPKPLLQASVAPPLPQSKRSVKNYPPAMQEEKQRRPGLIRHFSLTHISSRARCSRPSRRWPFCHDARKLGRQPFRQAPQHPAPRHRRDEHAPFSRSPRPFPRSSRRRVRSRPLGFIQASHRTPKSIASRRASQSPPRRSRKPKKAHIHAALGNMAPRPTARPRRRQHRKLVPFARPANPPSSRRNRLVRFPSAKNHLGPPLEPLRPKRMGKAPRRITPVAHET